MVYRKLNNLDQSADDICRSSRVNSSQIPFEIYEAAYEEEPEEDRQYTLT